jgi:hypothetical protein
VSKNRHGLNRNIPTRIKRALRQEAGFGCVLCGLAIGTFEHIIDFSTVDQHDPEDMAFLCHQCHGKVTRGHISKEAVRRAKLMPFAKRQGFSNEFFELGTETLTVAIGPVTMTNVQKHISINGKPVLSVAPPEQAGQPIRLNALLCNSAGETILEIVDNEWRVNLSNWDFEVIGPKLTAKDSTGRATLILTVRPGIGVSFDLIDMEHLGFRLLANGHSFSFIEPSGNCVNLRVGTTLEGMEYGIILEKGQIVVGKGAGRFRGNFSTGSRGINSVSTDVQAVWYGQDSITASRNSKTKRNLLLSSAVLPFGR